MLSLIPGDIGYHPLNKRASRALFPLKRLVEDLKPDCVMSTLGYVNVLSCLVHALSRHPFRLILREGSIVSLNLRYERFRKILSFMTKRLYKRANRIVCQSEAMLKDLKENFGVPSPILRHIPNPVDFDDLPGNDCPSPFRGKGVHVLYSGRLSGEKGVDRLIEILPQWLGENPDITLHLLGDGPQRDELKLLAEERGVSKYLLFHGYRSDPGRWMKHADLFVLPSRHEGMPNALIEAIACGCPVAVWAHPGGTREVLEAAGLTARFCNSFRWNPSWLNRDPLAPGRIHAEMGAEIIIPKYEELFSAQK